MPRYRVSRFEKMALDDLIAGNPYLWRRALPEEGKRLYAYAWLWFKPMTADQAELQSLYADDARADLGTVTERFSFGLCAFAWSTLLLLLWGFWKLFQ